MTVERKTPPLVFRVYGNSDHITTVRCIRSTAKTVTINIAHMERTEMRTTKLHKFFDTRAEAVAFLIARAERDVEYFRGALGDARARLKSVKTMVFS